MVHYEYKNGRCYRSVLGFSPCIKVVPSRKVEMKSKLTISLCLFTLAIADNLPSEDSFLYDAFPDDFMWAVASSAFQTEGAAGGRGVSVWVRVESITSKL